jgi:hypothetical protein
VKKQKLLLAALALLIGAASAAGPKSPRGSNDMGSNDMVFQKLFARSAP